MKAIVFIIRYFKAAIGLWKALQEYIIDWRYSLSSKSAKIKIWAFLLRRSPPGGTCFLSTTFLATW